MPKKLKKPGEFKAQKAKHKKRQTLWDGVKRLRNENAIETLTISGKEFIFHAITDDAPPWLMIQWDSKQQNIAFLVEVGTGKLVVARIHQKDCDYGFGDIFAGKVNDNTLSYRFHADAILAWCFIDPARG